MPLRWWFISMDGTTRLKSRIPTPGLSRSQKSLANLSAVNPGDESNMSKESRAARALYSMQAILVGLQTASYAPVLTICIVLSLISSVVTAAVLGPEVIANRAAGDSLAGRPELSRTAMAIAICLVQPTLLAIRLFASATAAQLILRFVSIPVRFGKVVTAYCYGTYAKVLFQFCLTLIWAVYLYRVGTPPSSFSADATMLLDRHSLTRVQYHLWSLLDIADLIFLAAGSAALWKTSNSLSLPRAAAVVVFVWASFAVLAFVWHP
jgi:hypothetical protein